MNKVLEAIELLSQGNDSSEVNSEILLAAKHELERALKDLENQRNAFRYEMELKQKSYDAQLQLFNMKWELLEEETRKLAEESKKAEKRRAFFERVNTYQKSSDNTDNIVHGEMFFKGVASPQALKKRYKDLIKIYHPDAEFGDNQTVQEINREYDSLRHAMAK
ncbi:MAG: molecular chaperone DnaJ [Lachnospiraceae bacterium]|nr:molecular chaperone DnaJ [Lachnospiraceae bacterium]